MIHFLHIGKTGGTALKHALEKTAKRLVTVHPHQVKLPDIPLGEPVFFFLRDPISRFVSGFISRQRQGRPRYSVPWNESETAAFNRFSTPNALAEALSADTPEERAAAEAAMNGIGHVRDSYWNWFVSPEYLRSRTTDILFIGQQEHLDSDVRVLSDLLKCGRLKLPDDDVAAHRNPEQADKSLTESAVTNLKQRLEPEFAAIQVCAEIARGEGIRGLAHAASQVKRRRALGRPCAPPGPQAMPLESIAPPPNACAIWPVASIFTASRVGPLRRTRGGSLITERPLKVSQKTASRTTDGGSLPGGTFARPLKQRFPGMSSAIL